MRRLLVLNLALVVVVVAAGVRLHNDWIMFEATRQPSAIEPQRETLPKLAPNTAGNAPAPADWTDIPSRNPFSFDRTDIAILEPVAPPAPPKPPGPKPILFGTITLGTERSAMVAQGRPGNRNYQPMKVGEVIDGWTITEILDKSIVIRANSIEDSVIMNDPSAQVPRDYTRTVAAPTQPLVVSGAPPSNASTTPSVAAPAPPSQPAAGQAPGRRRVIQQTPFGVREIEEP